MATQLKFIKETGRILYLVDQTGKRRGSVWLSASEGRWCWALFRGDQEGSIATGADDEMTGACTDLWSAFLRHFDKDAPFPGWEDRTAASA